MSVVQVTIGSTKREQPNHPNYRVFEPYEVGLAQHFVNVTFVSKFSGDPERVADQVYEAMNNPSPTGKVAEILALVQETGFNGSQSGHFSLSVGDTVTVDGRVFACDRYGWKEVGQVVHVHEEASC
jgi:hypothetical protein